MQYSPKPLIHLLNYATVLKCVPCVTDIAVPGMFPNALFPMSESLGIVYLWEQYRILLHIMDFVS